MAAYKSPKGQSGWTQLAIFLGVFGGGIVLASVIQFLFMNAMGIGLVDAVNKDSLMKKMTDPKNASMLQWMQFVSTVLMLLLPAYLFIFFTHGKEWFWGGFNRHFGIVQVILAVVIMWAVNAYAQPLKEATEAILQYFPKAAAYAKQLEDDYSAAITAMGSASGAGSIIAGLFITALLPGIFEEFFFRGVVQQLLAKWWKMPVLAIVVTSVLFSLVHFSITMFLSRFALGYALGLMFYYSRNIWINILAHFINNSLAFGAMYLSKKTAAEVMDSGADIPVWTVFISLAAIAGLFYLFQKVSGKYQQPIAMHEYTLLQKRNIFGSIA